MKEQLEQIKMALSGKTIGVVGVGISNTPIITMLAEFGLKVRAFDKRSFEQLGDSGKILKEMGVELFCGEDYMDHLSGDVIIKTPGMRFDHPALLREKAKGSLITSEMELFFEYCPCPILGITGSDGKTTTTSLVAKCILAAISASRSFAAWARSRPRIWWLPSFPASSFILCEKALPPPS